MILVVRTCSALGAENINKVRNPGCNEDNGGKDREKQQSSKEKVAVKWLWNGVGEMVGEIAPKQSRKKISSKLGSAGLHRIRGIQYYILTKLSGQY